MPTAAAVQVVVTQSLDPAQPDPEQKVPSDPAVGLRMRRTAHEKQNALAALCAGVAHELNNPAAYVVANLDHLRSRLTTGEDPVEIAGDLARGLKEALEGMRRIRDVVGALSVFSRQASEQCEAVDVNQVVKAVAQLCQSAVTRRARLELELEELPEIWSNPTAIAHALLNLLANAAQACSGDDMHRDLIRIQTAASHDDLSIAVSDTGAGIAQRARAHLFEPFFTTRPADEGTGLGLALSRELASGLGGRIDWENRPGMGATFTLHLPISAPPEHEWRSSGHYYSPPVARARVLLVDDEPAIRRALLRVLARDSDVITATTGEAAIDLLRAGLGIDVVISDLLLPGMTGAGVYEFIEQHRPELARRTLFLTGGAVTARAREFLRQHSERVLKKPVDSTKLRAIIQAVAGGISVRQALRRCHSEPER